MRMLWVMMGMLWVMVGMYVPFVAPSLTRKRCPCVTSVNCNIVRIALTHTHTHTGVLFGACQPVTLHTQPKAKQARSSAQQPPPGLHSPPPPLGL